MPVDITLESQDTKAWASVFGPRAMFVTRHAGRAEAKLAMQAISGGQATILRLTTQARRYDFAQATLRSTVPVAQKVQLIV
jgi:hypothetical protein